MMMSDFFALSSCAFSVLYAPFLIIAQLRFSHIMQNEGYSARAYFSWVKKNFLLVYAPLIGICLINVMAEVMMSAYLQNTALYYMQDVFAYVVIVGYLIAVAGTSAVIALVFYKYVKCVKIESEVTPLVCSQRFINLFMLSCLILCAITLLENLFIEVREMVFFIPLTAPLLVPLANKILGHGKQAGKIENDDNRPAADAIN